MENKITFDYSKAVNVVREEEVAAMEKMVETAKEVLVSRTGLGNDFLGWIDLPVNYDKEEFDRIKKAADKIKNDSDVLLVIGIGGSYLGARAAIDFLGHPFYNNLRKEDRKTPEIYYVGNNISGAYVKGLVDVIGDRDFSINVISKSGTTTEPAIAFRIFKEMIEEKYNAKADSQGIGKFQNGVPRGNIACELLVKLKKQSGCIHIHIKRHNGKSPSEKCKKAHQSRLHPAPQHMPMLLRLIGNDKIRLTDMRHIHTLFLILDRLHQLQGRYHIAPRLTVRNGEYLSHPVPVQYTGTAGGKLCHILQVDLRLMYLHIFLCLHI